jgi:hypothetical protein
MFGMWKNTKDKGLRGQTRCLLEKHRTRGQPGFTKPNGINTWVKEFKKEKILVFQGKT